MVNWRSLFFFWDRKRKTQGIQNLIAISRIPSPLFLHQRQKSSSNIARSIKPVRKYAAPKGKMEDKPLYALYRIYEHIMLDNNIGMRNELELFWWTRWPVADIPDVLGSCQIL